MTEEIINLKDYFIHHYDDWGRLYCVEFKGNPLELENSIKRLEQERDELKKACEKCKLFDIEKTNRDLLERIDKLEQENEKLEEKLNAFVEHSKTESDKVYYKMLDYKTALEEINLILDELKQQYDYMTDYSEIKEIQDIINECLGE